MLLSLSSSLYFFASSNLTPLNVGLWERPTLAKFWFEANILSAALCSRWNWKWARVVQETVNPAGRIKLGSNKHNAANPKLSAIQLICITNAALSHYTHLLTTPDEAIYCVFVFQQLSQLSGPQSTKLHRQRHDALCLIKVSSRCVLLGAMSTVSAAFKDCRKTLRLQIILWNPDH